MNPQNSKANPEFTQNDFEREFPENLDTPNILAEAEGIPNLGKEEASAKESKGENEEEGSK